MHSMHWRRWSTSRAESAETEGCGKRASVGVAGTKTVEYCAVHSMHWRGWSTSKRESAEPLGAASFRLLELQVLKLLDVHNRTSEPKAAAS